MRELKFWIDAPASGFRVMKTGVVWIAGWAFDAATNALPIRALPVVDGAHRGLGNLRIERPDVAANFGRREITACGFSLMLPTSNLSVGPHRAHLAFAFGENEAELCSPEFGFDVVSPFDYRWSDVRRILLVGAPKTGGTYQESVLCKYFGIDNPPYNGEWRWEPMLTDGRIPQVSASQPFITGGHLMPREPTLHIARKLGMAVAAGWRTIADALVSLDDHFHRETHVWPWTYVGDREAFLAMDDQARYRFLIRHAAPWYVDYYLAWRDVEVPIFARYEWMAADPEAFFSHFITCLDGHVDLARLRAIIGKPIPGTRLNKGVSGRGIVFDERARRMLEDLLREHFVDLDDLVEELPWRGGAQAAIAQAIRDREAELQACERVRARTVAT